MISLQHAVPVALFLAAAAVNAQAQSQNSPAEATQKEQAGKHYVLPANKDTVQWGWLDPSQTPKLTVNSGDTVSIETLLHAMDEIKPGTSMDEIVKLRLANPGGGPHSVTGPVYVNGAEPGDTLQIHIKKIVPKAFATNFHLPGSQFPTVGILAPEFPQGFVRYYYLDWDKKQAEFKP